MNKCVLVGGLGRSGSSVYMEILSSIGLPTGFDISSQFKDELADAGYEHPIKDICKLKDVWIYKNPGIIFELDYIFEESIIETWDTLVVPIRDSKEALKSRRKSSLKFLRSTGLIKGISLAAKTWLAGLRGDRQRTLGFGGVRLVLGFDWLGEKDALMANMDLIKLCLDSDKKVVLLPFPRFILDMDYLSNHIYSIYGYKVTEKDLSKINSIIRK